MIAAGQLGQPTTTTPGTTATGPTVPQAAYNPMLTPVSQPIWNGSTGFQTQITMNAGEMTEKQRGDFLDDQTMLQGLGMGANTLGALFNSISSWVGMSLQADATNAYFNYMNTVADNSMTVALEQLEVQEKGLEYARVMQEEQNTHEQRLAKINENLQIRLARISEDGRSDRAGIYMANSAFRSEYAGGSPISSLS